MANMHLINSYWEKDDVLKTLTSVHFFGELQLTQISLRFKTSYCNLKIMCLVNKRVRLFAIYILLYIMIITRVQLSLVEKILITESGAHRTSNQANFWQLFWGRQVNQWIFRPQILVMFSLIYAMLKILFLKRWSHSSKRLLFRL